MKPREYSFNGRKCVVCGKQDTVCGWALSILFLENYTTKYIFHETFEAQTGEKVDLKQVEKIKN